MRGIVIVSQYGRRNDNERKEAKELPGVFNNWAVFYDGAFQTVNQLDGSAVERLLKKS